MRRLTEAENELVGACQDLAWRDRQEGLERLLTNLMWWLDEKGAVTESLTIAGLRNEFQFNNSSSAALEHLLQETDCISVTDLLKRWSELEKLEKE